MMIADLQYLDDMLLKGGKEFLGSFGVLLLIAVPFWLFFTLVARFLVNNAPHVYRYVLLVLFPLHLGITQVLEAREKECAHRSSSI